MRINRRQVLQLCGATTVLPLSGIALGNGCPPGTRLTKLRTYQQAVPISGELEIGGATLKAKIGATGYRIVTLSEWECVAIEPPPPPPPPKPRRGKGSGLWDVEVFNMSGGIWQVSTGIDQFSLASNLFWDIGHPTNVYVATDVAYVQATAQGPQGAIATQMFGLVREGSGYRMENPSAYAAWMSSSAPGATGTTWAPTGIELGATGNGAGNMGVAVYLGDYPMVGTSGTIRAYGFNNGGGGGSNQTQGAGGTSL